MFNLLIKNEEFVFNEHIAFRKNVDNLFEQITKKILIELDQSDKEQKDILLQQLLDHPTLFAVNSYLCFAKCRLIETIIAYLRINNLAKIIPLLESRQQQIITAIINNNQVAKIDFIGTIEYCCYQYQQAKFSEIDVQHRLDFYHLILSNQEFDEIIDKAQQQLRLVKNSIELNFLFEKSKSHFKQKNNQPSTIIQFNFLKNLLKISILIAILVVICCLPLAFAAAPIVKPINMLSLEQTKAAIVERMKIVPSEGIPKEVLNSNCNKIAGVIAEAAHMQKNNTYNHIIRIFENPEVHVVCTPFRRVPPAGTPPTKEFFELSQAEFVTSRKTFFFNAEYAHIITKRVASHESGHVFHYYLHHRNPKCPSSEIDKGIPTYPVTPEKIQALNSALDEGHALVKSIETLLIKSKENPQSLTEKEKMNIAEFHQAISGCAIRRNTVPLTLTQYNDYKALQNKNLGQPFLFQRSPVITIKCLELHALAEGSFYAIEESADVVSAVLDTPRFISYVLSRLSYSRISKDEAMLLAEKAEYTFDCLVDTAKKFLYAKAYEIYLNDISKCLPTSTMAKSEDSPVEPLMRAELR